jgi:hypothetical protein
MKDLFVQPTGDAANTALGAVFGPVAVDTFAGRIHVEWDPQAAVTPLGQLPFFTEFLKISGLFDPWVEECTFEWASPNAPKKRDVLGTAVLSILAGHQRYAHISALRGDGINPRLFGHEQGGERRLGAAQFRPTGGSQRG